MSWMSALAETYDSCSKDRKTLHDKVPLVPICHTLNNMHITVSIDGNGHFIGSEVIPKDEQPTIIPCTESSAGRTSGLSPHPLDDKMIYLASGLHLRINNKCTGDKINNKRIEDNSEAFSLYVSLLKNWINADPTNIKIRAVLSYIESGTLIDDLVATGSIVLNDQGFIASKDECPNAPLFEKAKVPKEQEDAFIRWSVDVGDGRAETWNDPSMYSSWTSYFLSTQDYRGLCYITGDDVPLAKNHPSKIRNAGDGCKLISSNDNSGFTYRGRLETPEQAYGIGYGVSQKAHSALRWLIGRQGYYSGNLCIVTWSIGGEDVSNPADMDYDMFSVEDDDAYTNEKAAKLLNNRIRGYNSQIIDKKIHIMAMDSSQSAKGRLSISLYDTRLGEDFVGRLESWQEICAWKHDYVSVKDEDGKKRKITFIGAPLPRDIAQTAYGVNADDKLIASTIRRLLPCIIDGIRIPRDIVDSVVRRACNPVSMEEWEWKKCLSIACSVYKGYKQGGYNMTLEKERRSRDYLYGRLLAIAHLMESSALKSAEESRQTTATRYMQRFSEYPYSTWKEIELALVPYAARLGNMAGYYQHKISEIMDMFEGDDFRDNRKLSGEFLLAYHCQIEDHFRKNDEDETEVN